VHYVVAVEVLQAAQHSPQQLSDLCVAQSFRALGESAQQIPAFQVLQNHLKGVLGFEECLKPHYVVVVHVSQDFDLIEKAVEFAVTFLESALLKDLGCEPLTVLESLDFEDGARATFAEDA